MGHEFITPNGIRSGADKIIVDPRGRWDYVISPTAADGDTTSIDDIDDVAASKSILVRRGTYATSGNITPANDNQLIYFDDVNITGTHSWTFSQSTSKIAGKLTFNCGKDGTPQYLISGNDNNWSSLDLICVPYTGTHDDALNYLFRVSGGRNVFSIRCPSSSSITQNDGCYYYFCSVSGSNNVFSCLASTFTASDGLVRFCYVDGSYNTVLASITGVTTTDANNGMGLVLNAPGARNTAYGVTYNCDASNTYDGGTANNKAALIS